MPLPFYQCQMTAIDHRHDGRGDPQLGFCGILLESVMEQDIFLIHWKWVLPKIRHFTPNCRSLVAVLSSRRGEWFLGLIHSMKADVKPNRLRWFWLFVASIRCSEVVVVFKSTNIVIHFIEWHHICALSAKWGIVAVDTIRIKLFKWRNCLFMRSLYRFHSTIWKIIDHFGTFSGFKHKRPFKINKTHGDAYYISHVPILAWLGMASSFMSRCNEVFEETHVSIYYLLPLYR